MTDNASSPPNSSSKPAAKVLTKTQTTTQPVGSAEYEVHESLEYIHEGPLPPAHELKAYESVLPGLADRIVKMAEVEGAERRWRLRYALRTERLSFYGAFILAAGISGGSIWLVATGHPIVGLSTIVTEIAGLAAVFVAAKKLK